MLLAEQPLSHAVQFNLSEGEMKLFLKRLLVWATYRDVCWPHLNVGCWTCAAQREKRFAYYDERRKAHLRAVKQELLKQQEMR